MIIILSFDHSPDYLDIIILKAIKSVNAFFVFGTEMVKFHEELQIVCKKPSGEIKLRWSRVVSLGKCGFDLELARSAV